MLSRRKKAFQIFSKSYRFKKSAISNWNLKLNNLYCSCDSNLFTSFFFQRQETLANPISLPWFCLPQRRVQRKCKASRDNYGAFETKTFDPRKRNLSAFYAPPYSFCRAKNYSPLCRAPLQIFCVPLYKSEICTGKKGTLPFGSPKAQTLTSLSLRPTIFVRAAHKKRKVPFKSSFCPNSHLHTYKSWCLKAPTLRASLRIPRRGKEILLLFSPSGIPFTNRRFVRAIKTTICKGSPVSPSRTNLGAFKLQPFGPRSESPHPITNRRFVREGGKRFCCCFPLRGSPSRTNLRFVIGCGQSKMCGETGEKGVRAPNQKFCAAKSLGLSSPRLPFTYKSSICNWVVPGGQRAIKDLRGAAFSHGRVPARTCKDNLTGEVFKESFIDIFQTNFEQTAFSFELTEKVKREVDYFALPSVKSEKFPQDVRRSVSTFSKNSLFRKKERSSRCFFRKLLFRLPVGARGGLLASTHTYPALLWLPKRVDGVRETILHSKKKDFAFVFPSLACPNHLKRARRGKKKKGHAFVSVPKLALTPFRGLGHGKKGKILFGSSSRLLSMQHLLQIRDLYVRHSHTDVAQQEFVRANMNNTESVRAWGTKEFVREKKGYTNGPYKSDICKGGHTILAPIYERYDKGGSINNYGARHVRQITKKIGDYLSSGDIIGNFSSDDEAMPSSFLKNKELNFVKVKRPPYHASQKPTLLLQCASHVACPTIAPTYSFYKAKKNDKAIYKVLPFANKLHHLQKKKSSALLKKQTQPIILNSSGRIVTISKTQLVLQKTQPVLFYNSANIHVKKGAWVKQGSPILTLTHQTLITGDIVQGIPRIEQLFEAFTSPPSAFKDKEKGVTKFKNVHDTLHSRVRDIFRKHWFKSVLPIAVRKSLEEIQYILVESIQKVYLSQGVLIADKHIEIIIRQIASKGQILDNGSTGLFVEEILPIRQIENANLVTPGKKCLYVPAVVGLTAAALSSDSFISAASFQETTRVLSRDAIVGKSDFLRGLKEKVVIGDLISAGTGLDIYFIYTTIMSRPFSKI